MRLQNKFNKKKKVVVVGDSLGSLLVYDSLCASNKMQSEFSHSVIGETNEHLDRHSSDKPHFHFNVSHFFMFGSSLGLVLATRKFSDDLCN